MEKQIALHTEIFTGFNSEKKIEIFENKRFSDSLYFVVDGVEFPFRWPSMEAIQEEISKFKENWSMSPEEYIKKYSK